MNSIHTNVLEVFMKNEKGMVDMLLLELWWFDIVSDLYCSVKIKQDQIF